jgi:geranylgeranyl diphosphate synthase type II
MTRPLALSPVDGSAPTAVLLTHPATEAVRAVAAPTPLHHPGDRVEEALARAVERATSEGCPPGLGEALRYAVFPGGQRLRPRLGLAVAAAVGDARPAAADAVGVAVELMHCASLVHDDLPAFDDAAERRGRPSLHVAFGEPLAILAGDALIVAAFAELAHGLREAPEHLSRLIGMLARAAGAPHGLCAGQAWEQERDVDLRRYHRQKTASLFEVAAAGCALVGSGRPLSAAEFEAWREVGGALGEAYQVADDLRDALGAAAAWPSGAPLGKPVGRDEAKDRPSAVRRHGVDAARALLRQHVRRAIDAVPRFEPPGRASGGVGGREAILDFLEALARRFGA